ncbi:MAG TPA: transcription-repair coupling factor, partial [Campylobacterales bacterium]|nr:transcription-repair coupling factor [Campylobacterales bacterium]
MLQPDVYEYLSSKDIQPKEKRLLVCKNDKEAQETCDTATFLKYQAFKLPDLRVSEGDDLRSFQTEIFELIESLYAYYHCEAKKLLIAPLRTLLLPLPKEAYFKSIEIEFAATLKMQELKEQLYHWGYSFVDIVTQKGEVSFRGDIIDIYPLGRDQAYRLSLFDEEVENIRRFDLDSQKSDKEELESISILPAFLAFEKEEYEALKARVEKSTLDTFVKDIDSLGFWYLNEFAENYLESFEALWVSDLKEELKEIYSLDKPLIHEESFQLKQIAKAAKTRALEVANPNAIIKSNEHKRITIIAKNESIVRGSELNSFENINFVYEDIIVNLISEAEVIISLNKPVKRKKVKKASIILDELKLGDYV